MFLLTDEDDFHDVRSAVAGLAGKWQDLGSSLRLRSGDLEAILSASAHSPSDCLRKMLTLWLRENYNVCITLIYVILPPYPPHLPLSCLLLIWVTLWPRRTVTERLGLKFLSYLPGHDFTLPLSIICSCMVKPVWIFKNVIIPQAGIT